jgi:hypothetical protein
MAYTARQLITNAYYTAGIVAKDFQTLSGDQASTGLLLLNEFLAVKSINMQLIPYYTKTTITGVVGQELYFVSGLISIDVLTFDLNTNFRMPMTRRTREQYFGSARVNNLSSLPLTWRAERTVGGMNIYIYFQPDKAYPFNVFGKYALQQISSLSTDLSVGFDLFYISYMRYGLAEMLCEFYNLTLQPQSAQKLKEYEQSFKSINPTDYSMTKLTAFRKDSSGFGWGDEFIGHGYRPG